MKLILLTIGLFLAAAVHGKPYGGEPEYAMVPDADGSWKLVNINEDPEPENFFTPETDIIFTLFTRNNRNGVRISWNDPSWITAGEFNPANPTRITIHGWNGGPTSRVNTAVRESLFTVGDFNVIQVDWSSGAGTVNYLAARNRVGPTGEIVGRMLGMINQHEPTADIREMSAIGHSLGAHVAGFTGKTLGGMLGSIVALDAALPLFNINNPDGRVTSEDAKYVESIHTNAGTLGFDEPLGDANFYPNWGSSQPGCGIDLSGNCAHGRSHEFFAESILPNSPGFWATRCDNGYEGIRARNCINDGTRHRKGGEPVDTGAKGVYFVATNNASPFAQGM